MECAWGKGAGDGVSHGAGGPAHQLTARCFHPHYPFITGETPLFPVVAASTLVWEGKKICKMKARVLGCLDPEVFRHSI
ncbi:hypothetical protein OsI_07258 [Oryza sativa Indica Group]|uniref:Uncharacterized protein n=1 Tax=Oryza sativa subsp. indica TaxID=39946 RepID=A2X4Y7_ORYSI|nr:hypothetical protein OsI_07258 [Oryza sativa Indica Group]